MNSTNMSREEKLAKLKEMKKDAESNPKAYINNFCKTFDPKRAPHHLKFKLFPFQENLVDEIRQGIEDGYDIFIEKSRDMGASYTVLDVALWFWRYIPGSNVLLGSRKEAYVDNTKGDSGGNSNKEESLFGKIEYTLMRQPKFILPKGFDFRKHLTYMSLINPENGNVISGESSNQNFSRGGRYKLIILDEFAFWDNDTAAWGSTADTTNCRIVITTPGIKPGKAKRLRFGEDGEKIKIIELDYSLDPRKDDKYINGERERRSEEDFAREIMRNWDTSIRGRVYDEIKHIEVGIFPYNPEWPLFVTWDFGLDGIAVQWWQKNMDNGKYRLVEAYKKENVSIHYLFPFFPGNLIDSLFEYTSEELALIAKVSQWKKAVHLGDPDVAKRSITSKEKTSTRLELEKAGIFVQTSPEANTFAIRKEKTKVFLQKGIEVNDTPGSGDVGTKMWVSSIKFARYPQRNENSQATSPVTLPIHDWTSHHRSATEYLAVNLDKANIAKEKDPYKKYDNYKQPDSYDKRGYLI